MSGKMSRIAHASRTGMLAATIAALSACAHQPVNPPQEVQPAASFGSDCPITVAGTGAFVTDIADGMALTLTTRTGDVQALRRSAMNLAAEYNARFNRPGPLVRRRFVPGPARLAGGGYGSRRGEGSAEVAIPSRAPSRALVEAIPYGAKIVFRTDSPDEVRRVRTRVTKEAVQLWAGTCPSVG